MRPAIVLSGLIAAAAGAQSGDSPCQTILDPPVLYAGTTAGDEAGTSVDAAGTRLVIGVPETGIANGDGRVVTLNWDGTGWVPDAAELVDDDWHQGAGFGFAVAMAGDLLAVGAPQRDVGVNPNAGSVSVFERIGGAWIFQSRIVQTVRANPADGTPIPGIQGETDAQFGTAVDLWHDPATGTYRLLVGASLARVASTEPPVPPFAVRTSGRAFAFQSNAANPATWTFESPVDNPVEQKARDDDGFGRSVAIHSSVAVVGSPRFDDELNNPNKGAAFAFRRDDDAGRWPPEQGVLLGSPDSFDPGFGSAAPGAEIGFAVAVDAERIVVSAPADDPPPSFVGDTPPTSGVVGVYRYSATTDDLIIDLDEVIAPEIVPTIPDPAGGVLRIDDFMPDARFGHSVSLAGNIVTISAPRNPTVDTRVNGTVNTFRLGDAFAPRLLLRRDVSVRSSIGPPSRLGVSVASGLDIGLGLTSSVAGWTTGTLSDPGQACVLQSPDDDCNQNGIPDPCEIAAALETDCWPFERDPTTGLRGNGIPDTCDIAAGLVADCNGNGVPDPCELRTVEVTVLVDESGSSAGLTDSQICMGLLDSLRTELEFVEDLHVIWEVLSVSESVCSAQVFFDISCIVSGNGVDQRYGTAVPFGPPGLEVLDSCESWAAAAAIVADARPWRTAARSVVILSNECAWDGGDGPESCNGDDFASVTAAADLLACRDVSAFTVFLEPGSMSPPDAVTQMILLAHETSGEYNFFPAGPQSTFTARAEAFVDAISPQVAEMIILHDFAPDGVPDGQIDACQYGEEGFLASDALDCNLNGIADAAEIALGVPASGGPSAVDLVAPIGFLDECQICCPADIHPISLENDPPMNPDFLVGFEDILVLLSSWGATSTPAPGPGSWVPCDPGYPPTVGERADLDEDGIVGFSDLLTVLSDWGACAKPGRFPCRIPARDPLAPPATVLDCLEKANWDPIVAAPCIEAILLTAPSP